MQYVYFIPTQARGLSPREAARVQTFPDYFEFYGSYTKWYEQIGNACSSTSWHGSWKINYEISMKGFDLFSGIGGFHHGAHDLLGSGYETVAYCEIDPKARIAYEATLSSPMPISFSDVNYITGKFDTSSKSFGNVRHINKILPNFDILFAGFPCQPFSSMGKRNGLDDPRGVLFNHIEVILRAKKA